MQMGVKMSRVVILCLCYWLLMVSPSAGVSFKGEKIVDDTELHRIATVTEKGMREGGHSVSQESFRCSGLYSWCWSDWDCCTTWCYGYCYCLGNYDYCYYDYECCSGWCDRYYGCTYYPYSDSKKGSVEVSTSLEGMKKPVEKTE